MEGHFVYILKLRTDKTYVGCTSNLRERVERHQKGCVPATKNHTPVALIWYSHFASKYLAFGFEKYLKSGSGRVFIKKRLINNE